MTKLFNEGETVHYFNRDEGKFEFAKVVEEKHGGYLLSINEGAPFWAVHVGPVFVGEDGVEVLPEREKKPEEPQEFFYVVNRELGQYAETPCHLVRGISEEWIPVTIELPYWVDTQVHPDGEIRTKEEFFSLMMTEDKVDFFSIEAVELPRQRNWKANRGSLYFIKSSRYGRRYKCKFCGKDNLGIGDFERMHYRGCIKRLRKQLTNELDFALK